MVEMRVPGRKGGRGLGAGRTPAETGFDHALVSEERQSSASPQHERRWRRKELTRVGEKAGALGLWRGAGTQLRGGGEGLRRPSVEGDTERGFRLGSLGTGVGVGGTGGCKREGWGNTGSLDRGSWWNLEDTSSAGISPGDGHSGGGHGWADSLRRAHHSEDLNFPSLPPKWRKIPFCDWVSSCWLEAKGGFG